MMKWKYLLILNLFLVFLFSAIPVQAGTIENTVSKNIAAGSTSQKTGWKSSKGKIYYYINGVKQTGFVKINHKKYYFNKKGVMQTGWETIKKKKYYFNKNGVMQTGLTKIGKYQYYFNGKGMMQTGFRKIKGKKYYFNRKGRMQTGWKTIKKKKYYFNSSGVMQTGLKKIGKYKYYFNGKGMMQTGFQTVKSKKYYFNKKGRMQTGLKKISKKYYYFNSKGVMQTGFVTISGNTYYFRSNGSQIRASSDTTTVKIKGAYCVFDKKGIFYSEKSYYIVKGVKVHLEYDSDPDVSVEKLLAAIIYCEAGNQKAKSYKTTYNGQNVTAYQGQLAVGYVIANRLTSSKSYKEVIYQQYQFEPARTGVLTKYLNNYNLVSAECKNAAKIILYDVKHNKNSVSAFKRNSFQWQNFCALSYAKTTNFFSVYSSSEYKIIQDQVFFNYTKAIN